MPWVNIVKQFTDNVAEPGGAITAFAGDSQDGSNLHYSAALPNSDIVIWLMCDPVVTGLVGESRNNIHRPYNNGSGYSISAPGEGMIFHLDRYNVQYPGVALRAESPGRPTMFTRYRYRIASLKNACDADQTMVEAGLVLSHTSYGGMRVIMDGEANRSFEWTEVDFTGRESEIGPYEDLIGIGMLTRQDPSWGYSNVEEGWVMEWQVWVEGEDPEPEPEPEPRKLPWWLCAPPTPKPPCPVRPPLTGFVPFSEYDADFKYPLKSSRVPSPIKKDDGCIACGPVLTPDPGPGPNPDPDPDPDPDPECDVFAGESAWGTDDYGGMDRLYPSDIVNLPEDLNPSLSYIIYIDFTGEVRQSEYWNASRYTWNWDGERWEYDDGPYPPPMGTRQEGNAFNAFIASEYGLSCFSWESSILD